MKKGKVELITGGKTLAEGKIHRDALSPLPFVIAMMPFNHILRKCTGSYKFTKLQEKMNRLMYTDDIKLFEKYEKELETLTETITIYTQDIGMESGIEKCAMLIIKSGKRQITIETELPNQDRMRMLGKKETYKYLGILEADTKRKKK